jgi:hypothetical protein
MTQDQICVALSFFSIGVSTAIIVMFLARAK